MLSRVAESIYWMSRQIERAENVARFVDVNLNLRPDMPAGLQEQWRPLVEVTGDWEVFKERHEEANRSNVVEFLTFDPENPNSIYSCVMAARENARSVREIISSEVWTELNDFYLSLGGASARARAATNPSEFFRHVKRSSHLIEGVTGATMSHGEAWQFGRLGRMIERADKTTRILDVKYFLLLPDVTHVGMPIDDVHWSAVLRSASAFEMFRKRYRGFAADNILRFLVLERDFPRSVHYCAIRAEDSMRFITGAGPGRYTNPAERTLGMLVAELDYAAPEDILQAGAHEYLDALQVRLNDVGDGVRETFFP
jgi:uncharacterized alpha-E superfamily protein